MAEEGSVIEALEGAFELVWVPEDQAMLINEEVQRQIMVICKICGECTPESDLQSHMVKGHKGQKRNCGLCNVKVEDWYTHSLTYHGHQNGLSSAQNRLSSAQKPLKRNHGKKEKCDICEKKISIINKSRHMRTKHEGVPGKPGEKEKCDICEKVVSILNKSRHMREQHEGVKKSCPRCGKLFSASNLLRHVKQVHENETSTCQYCNKLLTPCNLNKHIKSVHMKLKEKCEICGVEMLFSSLYLHRKGHTDPSFKKIATNHKIRDNGSKNKGFAIERGDEAFMQRLVSQTFETVNINTLL